MNQAKAVSRLRQPSSLPVAISVAMQIRTDTAPVSRWLCSSMTARSAQIRAGSRNHLPKLAGQSGTASPAL